MISVGNAKYEVPKDDLHLAILQQAVMCHVGNTTRIRLGMQISERYHVNPKYIAE